VHDVWFAVLEGGTKEVWRRGELRVPRLASVLRTFSTIDIVDAYTIKM
jgi:hypothetical protein